MGRIGILLHEIKDFFFYFVGSLAQKIDTAEGFLLSKVSRVHWLPPKALNQAGVSSPDLRLHLHCYDYVGVCLKLRHEDGWKKAVI